MVQLSLSTCYERSFYCYLLKSPVGLVDVWQQHTSEKPSSTSSQKIVQNEKERDIAMNKSCKNEPAERS